MLASAISKLETGKDLTDGLHEREERMEVRYRLEVLGLLERVKHDLEIVLWCSDRVKTCRGRAMRNSGTASMAHLLDDRFDETLATQDGP